MGSKTRAGFGAEEKGFRWGIFILLMVLYALFLNPRCWPKEQESGVRSRESGPAIHSPLAGLFIIFRHQANPYAEPKLKLLALAGPAVAGPGPTGAAGQTAGPHNADQVLLKVYDAVNGALKANATPQGGGGSTNPTPHNADQVFLASYDPTNGAIRVNVITGSIADAALANAYSGVGACASSTWASTLTRNAAPTCTQPGFSNISGTVAASQLPTPTASTLGGVESLAQTTHQWINSISTSGVPSASQPASTSLSDYGSIPNAALAVPVPTFEAAGGGLTSQTTVNLQGTSSVLGLSLTPTNPSAGNVLYTLANTTSTNLAIGHGVLASLTNGTYNVALGNALANNTSGTNNVAIGGLSAMNANTSGGENVAVGYNALAANGNGSYNVAIGTSALTVYGPENYDTAIGAMADMVSASISNATALGYGTIAPASNTMAFGNNSITYNVIHGHIATAGRIGSLTASTLAAGGSGYAANDTGTVSGTCSGTTYQVLTVSGSAVATYSITAPGTGCTVASAVATAKGGSQPGSGSGFTVNITGVAPVVTGGGCSLTSGNDVNGTIAATAADSCTLTFGVAYTAPVCMLTGNGATVLPTISSLSTANFVAPTAAAGTFYYHCEDVQ